MKKNIEKIVFVILIFGCLLGLLYSIYNILLWQKDTSTNKKIKSETKIEIINNQNTDYQEDYLNDLSELIEKNADTVAYLFINDTNIDYAVVKSNDNDYYLNHNFNKEANSAGWIFADYRNKFDGTDKNIIIYGHNMKDGSMFGTLRKVLSNDWQNNNDNLVITLLTSDGIKNYQVFSTYNIAVEDFYIKTDFNTNEDYTEFLQVITKRSNKNYQVPIDNTDSIMTLSTCAGNGTKRVVLHAKLLK